VGYEVTLEMRELIVESFIYLVFLVTIPNLYFLCLFFFLFIRLLQHFYFVNKLCFFHAGGLFLQIKWISNEITGWHCQFYKKIYDASLP
jgi:hypothetical protein